MLVAKSISFFLDPASKRSAVFCLMWLFSVPLAAETVNVAVAANFIQPMRQLVEQFEADTGHQVRLSSGASGKFYAQILHGAPFHLFLSADQTKPKQLIEQGFAVVGTQFTYAIGQLVLWSNDKPSSQDNLQRLQQNSFNKLAIANPKLSPYGLAAQQVLTKLELVKQTQSKWVMAENIGQVYQFTHTQNAELGFVALSQLVNEQQTRVDTNWRVPAELYDEIQQDAVLLVNGQNNAAALALFAYLKQPSALAIIKAYGYKASSKAPQESRHAAF